MDTHALCCLVLTGLLLIPTTSADPPGAGDVADDALHCAGDVSRILLDGLARGAPWAADQVQETKCRIEQTRREAGGTWSECWEGADPVEHPCSALENVAGSDGPVVRTAGGCWSLGDGADVGAYCGAAACVSVVLRCWIGADAFGGAALESEDGVTTCAVAWVVLLRLPGGCDTVAAEDVDRWVQVRGEDNATADLVAVSMTGPTYCPEGICLVASGTGDARCGAGDVDGPCVSASGTGEARCDPDPRSHRRRTCVAVSGSGDAECARDHDTLWGRDVGYACTARE